MKHASLNDNQPHELTRAEAIAVAKYPHITRYLYSDFGYVAVSRQALLEVLDKDEAGDCIEVRKERYFAVYYFSKP